MNGQWVEAKDLKVSDELLNINLEKVGIISIEERLGDTVYNFTVEDNHNYFAENVLVHNTDYDKLSAEKQLEELKKTETVLSGSASFSETPQETFGGNINNTNTELFRQSLSDLIIVTKQNVNLTLPERGAFANKFEEIKNEINSTKVKNETINKYQEIAKELDKKLLINAIEKGQFQYYGSLEQKAQVSKYLVESLRNDLINASPEEQSEILKAVNYWEQTYNDLRNESVEETLKERRDQELQALNLVLLLADSPIESVSEIALSKLNTLVGSVGSTTLELINRVPILKTVFGRIFSNAKIYDKLDLEKYLGTEDFVSKFGNFSEAEINTLLSESKLTPKEFDLAFDPAQGRLNMDELNNALKAEKKYNLDLRRNSVEYKNGNPQRAADFIDINTEKTYDDFGTGPSEFFDEQFKSGVWQNKLINDHLTKADFVLLDTSKLIDLQKSKIQKYVESLPINLKNRIFI